MKGVKLVVSILGALVSGFLILLGVFCWSVVSSAPGTEGMAEAINVIGSVLIVVGVVFLCALIFHRQIVHTIQRVVKYLWPP